MQERMQIAYTLSSIFISSRGLVSIPLSLVSCEREIFENRSTFVLRFMFAYCSCMFHGVRSWNRICLFFFTILGRFIFPEENYCIKHYFPGRTSAHNRNDVTLW